ncbi:MAG TPA: helix-turn-helix transcriptional regulator [Pseudobdellovibrionaceae bacterium]
MDFKLSTAQEICYELGQRLKTQRLAKNVKQQELAEQAGISVGTVKNLESKGQASLENWIRIIIALDLTQDLEALFTLKIRSISEMEKMEKLKSNKISRRAR